MVTGISDTDDFTLNTPVVADIERPQAFTSLVEVDLAGVSHIGRVRPNNEDHFRIARMSRAMQTVASNLPPGEVPDSFEEVGYVLLVADGMGGASAGEVASMMAITLDAYMRLNAPEWSLKLNEEEARRLMERASRMIQEIDHVLTARAQQDPALAGMGTTLTAAYSVGDDLFIFHVGDSRAYLYRNGRLRQLTHDHTLAQALADAGSLAPEEVGTHRLRHILTNVVGSNTGEIRVEMAQLKLVDGDRLLLATDGLSEMVDDGAIAAILGEHASSSEACKALVERALAQGGKDNVTVTLAGYRIPVRPR